MLIRPITTLALVIVFNSVSANEFQSRVVLEVVGDQKIHDLNEPIVWRPISDQLSRFTLTLPSYGVHDAIKYQDTTSLYYLSNVEDSGLSLAKDIDGTFDFYLNPELSVYQYHHPITPAISLSAGAKFDGDEHMPILAGEYRSIRGDLTFQKHYLEISDSFVNLMMERTELNPNENLEEIWSISLSPNHTRVSYGWRWFEVIGKENLLAEISFFDEDLVFGWQIERVFDTTTGFLGSLTNTVSRETEAFWGIRYDFARGSEILVESDHRLLTNSAQSLAVLRGSALPDLWRSNVSLNEK